MKYRKLRNEELGRIEEAEFKKLDKFPIILIIDNVRSLNNIGSIFRTSDAFRIEKILICGISATPPNREIHKTALGAEEVVAWEYFSDTMDAIKYAKKLGYNIYSIEQTENSINLQDFSVQEGASYAFVFGNEVKGVAQNVVDASDECIEIPQYGTKHSFNVSVCVGIVLWHSVSPMFGII